MGYPSAPWNLTGVAYVTLHGVAIDRVRPYVPASLEIVPIGPGLTIGGVYLSQYVRESALHYSELIVAPAIVRQGRQIGGWISHIYVDNPDSVAGGREIWGLPKELAQFDWQTNAVTVRQADRSLCSLQWNWQIPAWRQPFAGPVLTQLHGTLMNFWGNAWFDAALLGADLTIPSNSPFASLHLNRPWLAIGANALQLQVKGPQPV